MFLNTFRTPNMVNDAFIFDLFDDVSRPKHEIYTM